MSTPPTYIKQLLNFCREGTIGWAELTDELRLTRFSHSLASLLGIAETELLSQRLPDVVLELAGYDDVLKEVEKGELPSFELSAVERSAPGGETQYLRFLLKRIEDDEREWVLFLVEDVTETMLMSQRFHQERHDLLLTQEQLRQANAQLNSLSRFKSFILSMLGHDLRTLMTVVLGYTDIILENEREGLNEWIITSLELMRRNASQANQLLTGILDIDAIERGALTTHPEPVNLVQVVRTALRGYEDGPTPTARLVVNLPREPVMVIGDPLRLHQVITNLLSNAVKYTPATGTITCTLRAACRGEPQSACLSIRDTGMGMSEEQAQRLFQPYYRTTNAMESKVSGAGLGLYIAKTLIEAQGGQITVQSTLGEGSTFTVSLPRVTTSLTDH